MCAQEARIHGLVLLFCPECHPSQRRGFVLRGLEGIERVRKTERNIEAIQGDERLNLQHYTRGRAGSAKKHLVI